MIITHPDNIEKIKYYFQKSNHIHLLSVLEIKGSPYLEKERWNGKWVRTKVLPDDRFTEWVDIENPSDWAIYFGLVKKEMELVFYEVKQPYVFESFKYLKCQKN